MESRMHALRAIELDPDLAEAHTSLGITLRETDDYARAEEEFRRRLEELVVKAIAEGVPRALNFYKPPIQPLH